MPLRTPVASPPTQQYLADEANRLRALAKEIPVTAARDRLIDQAGQLETKAKLERWLSSPGLKPPQ